MGNTKKKFLYGAGTGFSISNSLGTIVEHLFTTTTLDQTKISRPTIGVLSGIFTGGYFLAEDKLNEKKEASLAKKSAMRFATAQVLLTAIYRASGQNLPEAVVNASKISAYSVGIAPFIEYARNLTFSFNDVSDKVKISAYLKNMSKPAKKMVNYGLILGSIVVGISSYQAKKALFPDKPGIHLIVDSLQSPTQEKETINFPLNNKFTKPNEDFYKMYVEENKF